SSGRQITLPLVGANDWRRPQTVAQSVARFCREVWPIELQRPQCGAVYALVDLTLRAMGGTRCEFFTQLVQQHHTIVKPSGSIVLFQGN
ncbi:MAG: hypothetical protein WBM58_16425, partial [Sedimenticolaceae bacterium]